MIGVILIETFVLVLSMFPISKNYLLMHPISWIGNKFVDRQFYVLIMIGHG